MYDRIRSPYQHARPYEQACQHTDPVCAGETEDIHILARFPDNILLFDDSMRYGPIRRSSVILDDAELVSVNDAPFLGESLPFSLRDNFLDQDGDVLDIELTVTSIVAEPPSGPDVTWNVANAASEFRLEETEAGKFEFESTLDEEVVRYEILAHA